MKRSWNFCANTGNQKTGEQNPFYLQTTFPFPGQPHTFPRILSWNMSITGPSPKVHTMVPMPISPPKKNARTTHTASRDTLAVPSLIPLSWRATTRSSVGLVGNTLMI